MGAPGGTGGGGGGRGGGGARGGGGGGRGGGRGGGGRGGKKVSTKNQMRNIQRLLKREGLPEKLRLEKQRELEKLEVIFKENKQSELERKMAVRYHKVKFFERVKITRAIEKLEKANPVEAERPDAVTKNIESLRDDLHYVTNFPKGYKYVSVLKGDADDDAIRRKREKLRQIIKERGLADAALAEANEGGTDAAAAVVKAAGEKEKEKDDFFMESDSGSDSDSDSGSGSD